MMRTTRTCLRRVISKFFVVAPAVGCTALVLAIVPGTYPSAVAEEPAAAIEYYPQPTESEQRILGALAKHLTFEFQEMPLADLAETILRMTDGKAEVQFDMRALEDSGVGLDTPITFNAQSMSLDSALRIILETLDLEHLVKHDVIWITTTDKAESEVFARVYPVGDLVAEVEVSAPGGMGGGPKPADKPADKAEAPPADPKVRKVRDFDSLIEVLTQTVAPTTWDTVGGPATASGIHESLVVSQTARGQEEVLSLIRALRAAKAASQQAAE